MVDAPFDIITKLPESGGLCGNITEFRVVVYYKSPQGECDLPPAETKPPNPLFTIMNKPLIHNTCGYIPKFISNTNTAPYDDLLMTYFKVRSIHNLTRSVKEFTKKCKG